MKFVICHYGWEGIGYGGVKDKKGNRFFFGVWGWLIEYGVKFLGFF
jgi:hypothetical protein